MKCPVCTLELIVVERQGIELDYCIHCQGFWFDAGELNLVAEALGAKVTLPDIMTLSAVDFLEKPRRCPRCRMAMEKIRLRTQSGIIIDRCPAGDGIWFDKGELGKVLDQQRRQGSVPETLIRFLGETFTV